MENLFFLVYGAEFSGSAIALKILIWGLVFSSGNAIFGGLLTSIGKQKKVAYLTVLSAFGNITLNFVLIPLMSYVGASIASVIIWFLTFIIGFYYVSRNLRVLPIHKITLKPVVASLIMGAFVYFFIDTNIFLLVFCAAVTYLIALHRLKTVTEEDIEVLERLIGRDMHWILNWKSLIVKKIIKDK